MPRALLLDNSDESKYQTLEKINSERLSLRMIEGKEEEEDCSMGPKPLVFYING